MTCPACGRLNPPGMKFCGECGTRLASGCPTCGFQNPPGMKFCGECGSPLDTATGATPASPAAAAAPGQPALTAAPGPAEQPAGTARTTERRLVSVLFADLVGFTARSDASDPLAEIAAREAREILERGGAGAYLRQLDALVAGRASTGGPSVPRAAAAPGIPADATPA